MITFPKNTMIRCDQGGLPDKVDNQAASLSDGTLATLTGVRKYADLEEIQAAFVAFCAENLAKYTRWQDAWRDFEGTDANTWTPHEDVCPDCGEAKPDYQDFCDTCNAEGDQTAIHYGVAW